MELKKGNFWALLPLIVFIIVYFTSSLVLNDFYAVSALVVFMLAFVVAMLQFPRVSFAQKMKVFSENAGEQTILLMVLIFLFAGAFGQLGSAIGAVESTVNLALTYLPPSFIVVGFFLVACFISISIGTSVGTIVTLAPIAVEMERVVPGSLALLLGAIIGGAMFGDNLSFISDTTIAATRTQDIDMKSKFKTNFVMVLPAAFISIVIYYFLSQGLQVPNFEEQHLPFDVIKIIPYLLVFGFSIFGLNVLWSLFIGILAFLLLGVSYDGIPFIELVAAINQGFSGMFELSILCLVIGGVVGVIRMNGGLDFIIYHITRNIRSQKGAELSIAALTALANITLANNTITILIVGKIAKEISNFHQLQPKRVASILDTASCFTQGILPYGAQILAALAVTKIGATVNFSISPIEIISNLFYPFLTGICLLFFILFKKSTLKNETD